MPKAAGSTTPDATTSLISAAEQLFADRGIDGVSLREINREAGQRNTTSLQYHFGDREGLLLAIMAKHGREVDTRRHEQLDAYEAGGDADVRRLASAFVLPLVDRLQDRCGRHYLRIAAQLVNRDNREIEPGDVSILADPKGRDPCDSITRWGRLIAPMLPPMVVGRPLHRRYAAMRFAHIELGRRASESAHRTDALFASHLVDLFTSILVTPVSTETADLLAARRRR